ncbi:MAG: hypothetical protein WA431_02355 [Candidatus Cybelea sp.]
MNVCLPLREILRNLGERLVQVFGEPGVIADALGICRSLKLGRRNVNTQYALGLRCVGHEANGRAANDTFGRQLSLIAWIFPGNALRRSFSAAASDREARSTTSRLSTPGWIR